MELEAILNIAVIIMTINGGSLIEMKEGGPFTQVFGGPVARVLDQARIVGNMEQTVPILAESTGLTFKTVQRAIRKLVEYGFVKRSRRISNAQTYRFDVENDLHQLLAWADQVNLKQMRNKTAR